MNAKILNNEQTKLIVILLAVVMLFFSYQFGFSRYNDKTAAINEENKTLKEKQEELQGLVDKQTIYEDGITKYSKLIEEFTDRYGAGISIDKIIMFLVSLEKESDMEISAASLGTETLILNEENIPSDISEQGILYAYSIPVSVTYKTTYEGYKKCMTYINEYKERINVTDLNTTYDAQTGNLTGTMTLSMYYLTGTDKPFERPEISDINLGTGNIFGTLEINTAN